VTGVLVALGAAVGAPVRYLSDRAVQARLRSTFPFGTFLVNVVGSFILGAVLGSAAHGGASPQVSAAIGAGFCGALTTYSTFSYETLRLVEGRRAALAALNVAGSITVGLGMAAAGVTFGAHILS
jgi:fluoride exporter